MGWVFERAVVEWYCDRCRQEYARSTRFGVVDERPPLRSCSACGEPLNRLERGYNILRLRGTSKTFRDGPSFSWFTAMVWVPTLLIWLVGALTFAWLLLITLGDLVETVPKAIHRSLREGLSSLPAPLSYPLALAALYAGINIIGWWIEVRRKAKYERMRGT